MKKPLSWVYDAVRLDEAEFGRPPAREPVVVRLRGAAEHALVTGNNEVNAPLLEEAADTIEMLAGLQW